MVTYKSRLLETICGIPVYTFFGADGEDDGKPAGSEPPPPPGNEEEDDDDEDDEDDGDDSETVPKSKWRKADKQSRRRQRELNQARKEREDLQKQLDDIARKENSDKENADKDLQKATERNTHLEKLLHKNLLETAILKDPKRVWHDVSQTIAALPKDDVTVNLDTGEVEGLEDALTEVAKDKPFLVKETRGKKKQEQNGSGGSDSGNQQRSGSSGTNPAGTHVNNGGSAQLNRADLAKRIPALRR